MKKFIKIVLCALMLCTLAPIKASAETVNDSNTVANGFGETYEYFYNDEYFKGKATNYNASLATMSYVLTLSSIGESHSSGSGYIFTSENIVEILTEIGFEHIEYNADYSTNYTSADTTGCICAYKNIGTEDNPDYVVAVIPRSAGYGREWASNFTLGASGIAQGFKESAERLVRFANDYVANQEDEKFKDATSVKLWLAGYSRGAAIVNIAAAMFDDAKAIGGKKVNVEGIFAYTFETPNTANIDTISKESAKNNYPNIWNIINNSDFVTKVPPAEWGFIRYGNDVEIAPVTQTSTNSSVFEDYLKVLQLHSASEIEKLEEQMDEYDKQMRELNNQLQTLPQGTERERVQAELSELSIKNSNAYNRKQTLSSYIGDEVDDFYKLLYGDKYEPKALNVNAKTVAKVCLWTIQNWDFNSKYYESILIKESDETIYELACNFVTALATAVSSRAEYVACYQNICRIVGAIIGDFTSEANGIWMAASESGEAIQNLFNDVIDGIEEHYTELTAAIILQDAVTLNKQFTSIIKEALNKYVPTTADDYLELSKSVEIIVPLITKIICTCVAKGYGDTICNAIYNIESLAYLHYPQVCYTWLRLQDPNFTAKDGVTTNAVQYTLSNAEPTINIQQSSTTTKKGLFKKISVTTYTYAINVTAGTPVQSVTYKIGLLGSEKDYTGTISSSTRISALTIYVVDANGKLTTWYYNGIKTVQK